MIVNQWVPAAHRGDVPVGDDLIDQRRDPDRILVVIENAGAVHGGGNRGGGIGQHRHAHVERLDQRNAEPFVLARAQEDIRQLVVRRQLRIADVAEKVHVGHAQAIDQVLEHPDIALEAAVRADE